MKNALQPKYINDHGAFVPGARIPKGAVLLKLPATDKLPRAYVWVTNLKLARENKNGFYAHVFTATDRNPHVDYVDATRGFGKVLKKFIDTLPAELTERTEGERILYTRDIKHHLDTPRDRKVGEYLMRGRPGEATNPYTTTEYSVKGDFAGIVPVVTKNTPRTTPTIPATPKQENRPVNPMVVARRKEFEQAVNAAKAQYEIEMHTEFQQVVHDAKALYETACRTIEMFYLHRHLAGELDFNANSERMQFVKDRAEYRMDCTIDDARERIKNRMERAIEEARAKYMNV